MTHRCWTELHSDDCEGHSIGFILFSILLISFSQLSCPVDRAIVRNDLLQNKGDHSEKLCNDLVTYDPNHATAQQIWIRHFPVNLLPICIKTNIPIHLKYALAFASMKTHFSVQRGSTCLDNKCETKTICNRLHVHVIFSHHITVGTRNDKLLKIFKRTVQQNQSYLIGHVSTCGVNSRHSEFVNGGTHHNGYKSNFSQSH